MKPKWRRKIGKHRRRILLEATVFGTGIAAAIYYHNATPALTLVVAWAARWIY